MAKKISSSVATKAQLKKQVLEILLEEMETNPPLGVTYEKTLKNMIDKILLLDQFVLSEEDREHLAAELFEYVTSYAPIEPLIDDPRVSEIMINGFDSIYKEINGEIFLTDLKFKDELNLRFFINNIINPLGRYVNHSSPLVDSHLPDGSRLNVVIPPIVKQGPIISIRKFLKNIFTIRELLELNALSEGMAEFLNVCVRSRLNILVGGNTSSGKTTLLNILAKDVSASERIITIEDSLELQLHQPHVISLEARPADNQGEGVVTIRDLVKNVLRMRPDRIIVGEVRGVEALDMLQAMNTGHDGVITTIHANSARDSLARLETMCLMAGLEMPITAIRKQIASALDLIVYLTRFPDGTRKVTQITEVVGMEGDVITTTDLFLFSQSGVNPKGQPVGQFRPTGLRPMFARKITDIGLQLTPDMFK